MANADRSAGILTNQNVFVSHTLDCLSALSAEETKWGRWQSWPAFTQQPAPTFHASVNDHFTVERWTNFIFEQPRNRSTFHSDIIGSKSEQIHHQRCIVNHMRDGLKATWYSHPPVNGMLERHKTISQPKTSLSTWDIATGDVWTHLHG